MSTELLTSIYTLTGGLILIILSRFIEIKFIEPYLSLKKEIGRVKYSIVFYADLYCNPSDHHKRIKINQEASAKLRSIASNLISKSETVSPTVFCIFLSHSKEDLFRVSKLLIGLSNSLWDKDCVNANIERRTEIAKILNMKLE